MKYILFLIVLFFSSFNLEYREKWVCHTAIEHRGGTTCIVIVVKADTWSEAETIFNKFIKIKEQELGGKEIKGLIHGKKKYKDSIYEP